MDTVGLFEYGICVNTTKGVHLLGASCVSVCYLCVHTLLYQHLASCYMYLRMEAVLVFASVISTRMGLSHNGNVLRPTPTSVMVLCM